MGLIKSVAEGKQITQSLANSILGLQGSLAQLTGPNSVQRTAQEDIQGGFKKLAEKPTWGNDGPRNVSDG